MLPSSRRHRDLLPPHCPLHTDGPPQACFVALVLHTGTGRLLCERAAGGEAVPRLKRLYETAQRVARREAGHVAGMELDAREGALSRALFLHRISPAMREEGPGDETGHEEEAPRSTHRHPRPSALLLRTGGGLHYGPD